MDLDLWTIIRAIVEGLDWQAVRSLIEWETRCCGVVFRPMGILSRWEICWELFPSAMSISRRSQRNLVWPIVRNHGKGSGVAEGLLNIEWAHFIGFYRCIGNEGLWDRCNKGNLGLSSYVQFQTIPCWQEPFCMVKLSPISGVTCCWNIMRNNVYGWEECLIQGRSWRSSFKISVPYVLILVTICIFVYVWHGLNYCMCCI